MYIIKEILSALKNRYVKEHCKKLSIGEYLDLEYSLREAEILLNEMVNKDEFVYRAHLL